MLALLLLLFLQPPDPQALTRAAASWRFGQPPAPLEAIDAAIRQSIQDPARRQSFETALLELLTSDSTPDAKDYACRQLSLLGTETSVPALTGLLFDPQLAEIARFALTRIPGAAADRALLQALPKADGKIRLGLIESLTRRHLSSPLYRQWLGHRDTALAQAAAWALGRTGTAQDAASLLAVREKNPAASEAALDLAARLGPKGASIYRTLAAEGEPPLIRAAALEGLFNTDPKAALPLLQSAARTPDPVLQSRAIRCLVAHGHAAWLMEQVASFAPRAQVWVLTALTERKSPGARPLFLRAIDSPEPEIRLAGLQGLAAFGTQDDVLLLATRAASSEGPEQEAARGSLWRLADPGVDATIRSAIVSAESPIQAELVRACAERGLAEATPQVITVFQSGDRNVRREALRALRDIAPADSLPSLVPLLAAATAGTEKREAERMLASTLKRHPETGLDPILKTYRSASSSEDRTSLLSVLGQAGRPEALPLFTEVLSAPDATLRRAAILALTEWPTQAPATELLRVAGADAEQPLRILALRGYIRLVSQPSELTPAESVSQLKAALAMNPPVEEKRAVLAALPRFVCPEALQVAKALAQDSTVAAEAQTAASRLENSLKYRQ